LSLLPCELTEVAVLAQSKSVVRLVFVFTLVCELGAPMAMVTGLAEPLGVEGLVCVLARVYLFHLAFLDRFARPAYFFLQFFAMTLFMLVFLIFFVVSLRTDDLFKLSRVDALRLQFSLRCG
jgi:hypothetical protein